MNQLVQHLWSSKYVQHWMLDISHSIIGTKTLPAGILKMVIMYVCTGNKSPKKTPNVIKKGSHIDWISIAIIPPEHLNLTLVCYCCSYLSFEEWSKNWVQWTQLIAPYQIKLTPITQLLLLLLLLVLLLVLVLKLLLLVQVLKNRLLSLHYYV